MCDDHSNFLWKRLNPFSLQVIELGIPGFADRRTGFNVERGLRPKTNPSTWLPAIRLWQVREKTVSVKKQLQKALVSPKLITWSWLQLLPVKFFFDTKSNLSTLVSYRPCVTVTEQSSCKETIVGWQDIQSARGKRQWDPRKPTLPTWQLDN